MTRHHDFFLLRSDVSRVCCHGSTCTRQEEMSHQHGHGQPLRRVLAQVVGLHDHLCHVPKGQSQPSFPEQQGQNPRCWDGTGENTCRTAVCWVFSSTLTVVPSRNRVCNIRCRWRDTQKNKVGTFSLWKYEKCHS